AGIANMVPVIGGVVATVLIAAITPLQMGFSRMLIVLLVYGAIQFVTDRIVSPKLMSENARLHPIAVILALLVAAEFLGMIGVFIAVPVLAVAKVVYTHYRAYMREDSRGEELAELMGRAAPSAGPAQREAAQSAEATGEAAAQAGAQDGAADTDGAPDGDA
ncbi:MAG: AI-2E family transporter, partial [Armatimonadota bacterium]